MPPLPERLQSKQGLPSLAADAPWVGEADSELGPCPCALSLLEGGWLDAPQVPMPALDDQEGERVSASLPEVIDAHVHVFPARIFAALWRWFDAYGWPIRYRLEPPAVAEFLIGRGVSRIVALHYAHKPGIARSMNRFMADLTAHDPRIAGTATVFPGEPEARDILREGLDLGLGAVKLHCHVQAFAPDAAPLAELYALCAERGAPLVMHAGREPASQAYPTDPRSICSAERIERVLRDHPTLKLVVPHLGADEFDAYEMLLERHDNLWLDTTMVAAEYFPIPTPVRLMSVRPERVLYGSDFPNLPYAWDRELVRLEQLGIGEPQLELLLGGNARSLFFAGSAP